MTTPVLVPALFAVNALLCVLVAARNYRRAVLWPVVALSLCTPVLVYASQQMFLLPLDEAVYRWTALFGVLLAACSALSVEIAVRFMRASPDRTGFVLGETRVSLLWLCRIGSMGLLVLIAGGRWGVAGQIGLDQVYVVTGLGMALGLLLFVNGLLTLYILENTFRFSAPYQRRIGRLCFSALALVSVFLLVFSVRVMLYRVVSRTYADLAAVILTAAVPVLLSGLIRYRLGTEHISISRQTVYSSVTLLLVGAVLLGLSGVVAIGRWYGVTQDHFEVYLVLFALGFFCVLVISSGSMRIRVMQFINTHIYTHKYDYREQFFRLHRTSIAGSDIEGSVTELVENMKYAVAVDDAFVFLANGQDGVFVMHQNQEFATPASLQIAGDHPFVSLMRGVDRAVDFASRADAPAERQARQLLPAGIADLGVSSLFPIRHQDDLVGFLGIRQHTRSAFDAEDLELIKVFTSSIGNVVFKQRVLRERIEHKQFESFTRVASFIIHDIKNQVATLTLLLRNADRNMSNPAFQKSLLSSVRDTSRNLQNLVDKLAASRSHESAAAVQLQPINTIVAEAVNAVGLDGLDSLTLELVTGAPQEVQADRGMLFYVVKNLVVNALEAMDAAGVLHVETGRVEELPSEQARLLGIGAHLLHRRTSYILVADTGRGMSPAFVRDRLFHPFSSTKDKGVGIGLYQCKTLVERDGGTIRCYSRQGEGTTFCIIV